jgi:transposase
VCFLQKYFPKITGKDITNTQLSLAFKVNIKTIRKYLFSGPEPNATAGRHRRFSDDGEEVIVQKLTERYQSGKAMTRRELFEFLSSEFGEAPSRGWIESFLTRHSTRLQICDSHPQEDVRITIPREYLLQHIQNMQNHVTCRIAELVFNIDEVGASDWEDRKVKQVIAPAEVHPEDVFHPISRRFRHMTLVVCVSAGGDALCPMLIMASAIPVGLCSNGLRLNEDVIIKRRAPAYVDEELFHEYLSEVLVQYVRAVREKLEKPDEPGILLMDGMRAHCSERNMRLLGDHNILAIIFPAHTSNLFQALDLSFFGALKHIKITIEGDFQDDSLRDVITKLLKSYEKTGTSFTVRASFIRAGFRFNIENNPYTLEFDEEAVKRNPGFQEIWEKNYTVEDLTRRRSLSKFGLMNLQYLPQ